MVFKSKQPDIDLPTNLTTWSWLFESTYSPLSRYPADEIKGFMNCATNEYISYLDLKDYATFLSTALVENYGFQEGDTVALFSPNNVWYPVAMHGVLRVGGVISGASPAYNVEEMSYALSKAKAKYLMTVPGSMEIAAAAAEKAGIEKSNVFLLEGELEGFTTLKQLIEVGRGFGSRGQVRPFVIPAGKTNGDVCGFLSFSSGTTGLPKAVMISHQNILAQSFQIASITDVNQRKVLAVLPYFHITGLVHVLHIPIFRNCTVYLLPTFTMPSMLSAVSKYQIEELLLVPPIIIRMVRDPLVSTYDLHHIKRFSSGAAPLSAEILQQLAARFPWTGFKQGYGMTESTSCLTCHPPWLDDYKYAHTVGEICASTELKIVDEDGNELGVDQPGELLGRGPQVTMGYLGNATATRETYLEGGWLRTGDQGMIDAEGVVTITDRLKEMIKVRGIAVAPAELEDLLLGHEAVEDCAVVGVRDEYSGEKPKAFVVRKGGGKGEGEEVLGRALLAWVREKKVRYKWLKEVEFVDAIPKSASGKILRRVLREMKGTGVVVREEREPRARL